MKWINRLDAHHKLYISLTSGLITFFLLNREFSTPVHIMLTWLAYVLASLLLSWVTILSSHPADVKKEVYAQDSGRTLTFLFTITAAFASLFAMLILLQGSSQTSSQADLDGHIMLSLACVISSWCLVHTIFTMRYAIFITVILKTGTGIKIKSLPDWIFRMMISPIILILHTSHLFWG